MIFLLRHLLFKLINSQITVNDLPVGRSVDETIRLIKAFQFTVRMRAHPVRSIDPL